MKEILFRGRNKDWYNGDLIHYGKYTSIRSAIYDTDGLPEYKEFVVIPETIGQFTGLTDINGVNIFDGDIVKCITKHTFNSDLLDEFRELNNLETINNISLHFIGIVRVDFLRGLMFENPENGYREPMFSRHINIRQGHSNIEVIGNIYDNPELIRFVKYFNNDK